MGYDLHTHSTYSDGSLKPIQLINKAKDKGLSGIALTDHDSIGGIAEAKAEAERIGLPFIPGVELTTDYGDHEIHILGYHFNLDHPGLLKKFDAIVKARNDRAKLIVQKLNKQKIPITWEKVSAKTTSKFVGRTHIFRAMEEAGLVNLEHRRSVFEFYLGKKGVAYVPHEEISTIEAIELINQAGGVPVIAHPGRMNADFLLEKLFSFGVRGLEVYYPTHTPHMVEHYRLIAQQHNLIITGGSDYHGAFSQTRLGDAQVENVDALMA